jgi:predicted GH43/DUF377 family glycosyl hydrolase
MSPAVIEEEGRPRMLYRRVVERVGDPRQSTAYLDHSVIALADSADGVRFSGRPGAVLEGGAPLAAAGVEDPTIVRAGGELIVFYTGWTGWKAGIASLLWARGPSLERLRPEGVAIAPLAPTRFVKEAEALAAASGVSLWCEIDTLDGGLERSLIAFCRAPAIEGPYPTPQVVARPRPNGWDSVNVSTGPLLQDGGRCFMFYNGMVRLDDPTFMHAARIGLMELDPGSGRVLARSTAPVLEAPAGARLVFSASVWDDRLYYTVDDSEIWMARIDRRALATVAMEAEA